MKTGEETQQGQPAQGAVSLALPTLEMPTADALALIDERIAKMQKIQETPYRTTGNIKGFNDVKTETNVATLIKMFSSVRGRENSYYEAADELGLTTRPQFSDGGTKEDWKHDIQLRIAIIRQDEELKKLTKYKEEMSKFLSDQDRKAMLMKEMNEFFSTSSVSPAGLGLGTTQS